MGYISLNDFEGVLRESMNKVTFFNTVADLVNSNNLNVGQIVETLGYYVANDGGGARYIIVSNIANPISYFEINIGENLYARILPNEMNVINFRKIGGKAQDSHTKYDNKTHLEAYLLYLSRIANRSQRPKLYIPSGIWNFSPTIVYNSKGFSITGDVAYAHRNISNQGTIINALNDNQEYVWQVGKEDDVIYNFELGNLTFSANNFLNYSTNNFSATTRYNIGSALYMTGLCHGIIHPLSFMEMTGTAFKISSSWELRFAPITFRYIGGFTTPVMKMASVLDGLEDKLPNISNVHFDLLDFEIVAGDLVEFEKDSTFINSSIDKIVVESSTYAGGRNIEFSSSEFDPLTLKSLSIVKINGSFTGSKIGPILINNFPWVAVIDNNQQYLYDTVIGTYGNLYKVTLDIPLIATQGTRRNYNIIKNFSGSPNSHSTIKIGQVQNESSIYKGIYNITNFPTIITEEDYGSFFGGTNLISGDFIPARSTVRRVSGWTGMLTYSAESLSPDNIVVRPLTWIERSNAELMYLMKRGGKSLSVKAKIPSGQSVEVWVHKRGDQNIKSVVTLIGDGTFKNYLLLSNDDTNFVAGDLLAINIAIRFNAEFDFFIWE